MKHFTETFEIKNLTPHQINILDTEDVQIASYPSDGIARVTVTRGEDLGGGLFGPQTFGEVTGLPAPQEGVIYVVSALVAAACGGRKDVFSPSSLDMVRNEKGHVIGTRALACAGQ